MEDSDHTSLKIPQTSLEFLRTNVEVNRKTIRQAGAGVEVMALEWGNQSHADAIRKACLPSGEEFDLVLGSELLYDADNYSSLLHVLSQFVRGAVGVTEERQGERVDGGQQERVKGKGVDTDGTIAVLSYTHRSGSEARFLSEAAKRFQISTQEFTRTDQNPAWALSTLRPLSRQPARPPLTPHITPLSRLSGQTLPPLRRHLCSCASPDTSASPYHPSPLPAPSPAQIDGAISRLTAEIAREEYSSWRGEAGSWGAAATPDLAFAFNSGCGTDQDARAGAIDQLLHEGTPSASHCTAYCTHLI